MCFASCLTGRCLRKGQGFPLFAQVGIANLPACSWSHYPYQFGILIIIIFFLLFAQVGIANLPAYSWSHYPYQFGILIIIIFFPCSQRWESLTCLPVAGAIPLPIWNFDYHHFFCCSHRWESLTCLLVAWALPLLREKQEDDWIKDTC